MQLLCPHTRNHTQEITCAFCQRRLHPSKRLHGNKISLTHSTENDIGTEFTKKQHRGLDRYTKFWSHESDFVVAALLLSYPHSQNVWAPFSCLDNVQQLASSTKQQRLTADSHCIPALFMQIASQHATAAILHGTSRPHISINHRST